MARYARGKKSNAMSDISGFKVKYKNLKTTWDNLRVEPEEYDPKQPQLTPAKNVIDATALFQPSPDNDPDNFTFFVGYTQDWTVDPRDLPGIGMHGIGAVGNGVNAEINTLIISVTLTGVAGTGAIGTETPLAFITETGVAGTGALGAFGETDGASLTLSITETSTVGTGAIGTESVDVDNPTWGSGGWGEHAWGQ